jgi:YggT family protein
MAAIASVLSLVLWLFVIVTLVRVAFSWVSPYPNNPVYRLAYQITEPVLAPVRRVLPPMSGMDLSPLVVTVACYFLIHALGFIGS